MELCLSKHILIDSRLANGLLRQSRCVRLAGAKVEREQQQQDVHYESIDGVGIISFIEMAGG